MKKYLLSIFILASCLSLTAQHPYGRWVSNYNKQFWRIFVYEDGIYRIDSTTLADAGVPTNTDPRKFQIFGCGKQQYIYVKGESDGVMNSGDFIEFYGMHNDGWYDSALYANPADQPNPNYSMFNDTAIYYLSISIATNDTAYPKYRMTSETDVGSYPSLSYFNKVSRVDYTGYYSTGTTDGNGITDPEYIPSEGWFDAWFSHPSTAQKDVLTKNVYSSGYADIEFLIVGASDFGSLDPDHHITMTLNTTTLKDTSFEGYYAYRYSDSVPVSLLGSTNSTFRFYANDDWGTSSGNTDYNTISYINVKYPHTLDLEGDSTFIMYAPYQSGSSKVKLSLSDFTVNGSDSVRFYDITNHKRIRVAKNGVNYDVVLPNGAGEKKCYVTSEGQIKNISYIDPVNDDISNFAKFTDFTAPAVLSSNYIIVSHKSLWSAAEDYKTYRNSTEYEPGHPYVTLLVDVNELYDQFSYGIRKDPMAIRNFIYYANDNFYDSIRDVFLIGKGYRAALTGDPNRCFRKNAWYYSSTLIPGFGVPPVDILFAKRDTSLKPIIPIGRLAAQSIDHVEWYLNKVEEYESMQAGPPQEWMKYILHFGGGNNQSQVNTIANYLKNYEDTIENPLFGGYVRTFLKTSPDPIQINTADSLRDLINNGVSMMTFFGHAAGIGFDYSIDYPSNYDNHEKYPFLLALSCLAGDLFNETVTSTEEFVLIEDKGTIGYLASVTKAEMPWLDQYASLFYTNISKWNYGKPVGFCIQQTIDSLYKKYPSMFGAKSVCLEMTLHGDPAIKINSFRLPDYEISQPDVYFTPSEVTTLDSTFTVNIISTNLGRAIDTVFKVNVHREFPDGTSMDTNFQVNATIYKDTFQVTLPVDLSKGVGLNYFTVWLDNYNEITEISETNNSTTVSLNIKSNDITPVYPYEFAIVPTLTNLTLKASTGDPFAPLRSYIFQLDTTDAFTNPLVSQVISHTGGVVTWIPVFPITSDSIVYFWRCSPDSSYNGSYSWRESSFQYIPGKRGWGQAHFFQFKKDDYQYVNYNKPARRFQFVNDLKTVWAQTGYFNFTYDWLEEKTTLNGYSYPGMVWTCLYLSDGFKIIVYDSISGEPWEVPGTGSPYWTSEGAYHCQNEATNVFDFYIDGGNALQDTIANFINSIPQNDYVLAMSHKSHRCEDWNTTLVNAFRSIGSIVDTNYRIENYKPYIIFGKKGAIPGSAKQSIGTGASGELIQLEDTIQTKWNEGYIQSTTIGPAASWDSLFWRVESIDPQIYDKVRLSVIGIKSNGDTATLISNLTPIPVYEDMSIHDLVDSSLYPYIKLIAVMEDDSFHTPYQMLRWQVTYEPMPETALDPSLYFTFESDTLDEGDSIHFACATHNISEFDMTPLLIHFWVIDANREVARDTFIRYEPHPAGDTLIGSVTFDTDSLAGINELWVEVNPDNDQLEQYHFNNIGSLTFLTNADKINPLLDVTFDGVHIMDDDIVSAKPLIEIRLKDENKFLLLNDINDTALFKVFIKGPDDMLASPVYFTQESTGEEIMHFYPAPSSSDNKCRIEYYADFPEDGTYTLIVQAKDKSRNNSGNEDYEVEFEVINKSTITQVMNWPNPFSTATHFVFTLTGSELPTYFKIQIMTITGKVVREINMDELGSLHIGRNITTYAWDGKDDYGDQLANGVYLYRVVTHINGKIIEKSQTEADKYFKEEFGKMYLMR